VSAATLPIAAAGSSGASSSALAAAERVQQLQALVAQVERRAPATGSVGKTGSTFAATLDSAQAGDSPTGSPVGAYNTAASYPTGTPSTSAASYPISTSYTTAASSPAGISYPTGTPSPTAGLDAGAAYAPLIEQAAARYGLDPSVLHGLIQQESGFDPSARSGAGALGLTQLMPSTAASLGVAEPLDPAQSIEGGARYLSQLLNQFAGNTADALAAYNAGPGAVQQYGGVPPYPETQQYVAKVLGYAASYQGGGTT
jgi:soluble lytic murein transglycosylase-like protein